MTDALGLNTAMSFLGQSRRLLMRSVGFGQVFDQRDVYLAERDLAIAERNAYLAERNEFQRQLAAARRDGTEARAPSLADQCAARLAGDQCRRPAECDFLPRRRRRAPKVFASAARLEDQLAVKLINLLTRQA